MKRKVEMVFEKTEDVKAALAHWKDIRVVETKKFYRAMVPVGSVAESIFKKYPEYVTTRNFQGRDMKAIKYKDNGCDCTTPCPHGIKNMDVKHHDVEKYLRPDDLKKVVRVHSFVCCRCEFFDYVDKDKKILYCNK